jgi:hypothetical protein
MSPQTDADIRSPWYETFAPAMWVVTVEAQEAPEPPAEAEEADEGWATEALFEYYND